MKNPFKKQKDSQLPTKVKYRYCLHINYINPCLFDNWRVTSEEKINPEEAFQDEVDWYTLKPNTRYFKMIAKGNLVILDRENISGMSIDEEKIIIE